MNWRCRLVGEREELDDKVIKLSEFIGSETYNSISENQKILLKVQLVAMKMYRDTLDLRLEESK